jgi:hypothetical protein
MAEERLAELMGSFTMGEISQPHNQVAETGGGQGAAVRRKCHGEHRTGGVEEGLADRGRSFPVGQIPQSGGLVFVRGGQGASVRRKGHAGYCAGLTCRERLAEWLRLFAIGEIPQPDGLSLLALAKVRPSGENATLMTTSVSPVRGWPSGWGRFRSLKSHNLTVRSTLAVARVRPSGLNATDSTELV